MVPSWVSPRQNRVKVNVDTTLFEMSHNFGFGLVARDSNGILLQGRTVLALGQVKPALAEAMEVPEALSRIKSSPWHHVVLEIDSLVVVQALQSSVEMISLFGLVIKECKE
uniref:RNase H type-1 domain-containing protein n=1 Tax=Cannabis sativa TaxID=3483 RepID=A0A803NUP7_CANSA